MASTLIRNGKVVTSKETKTADVLIEGEHIAAAFRGTTTIVDFAIQARGTRRRQALHTWWKKAEGKTAPIYHALTRPRRAGL